MSETILADARERPDLFGWVGAVNSDRLCAWLRDAGLAIPGDLVRLWEKTGGGELFETATILGPFGDVSLGDDVRSVNELHRSRGMPRSYLIFAVGLGLAAIRLPDGRYVQLDENTYEEQREYPSLDAWYEREIRGELADRYGLVASVSREV